MKKEMIKFKKAIYVLMLLISTIVMTLSVSSCSKWIEKLIEDETKREEIPGLGNAAGNLTGTPFKLPEGIELTEEITGAGYQNHYWITYAPSERLFVNKDGTVEKQMFPVRTRAGEDIENHHYGSGYGYVDLLISLRNTRTNPVEVTIPAASIFVSKAGDCQNGVLIKKVTFTIPANSVYLLCLSLYCGNSSKSAAGYSDQYVFSVVSNAKPLLDLCDRVKNKKINIEEFSKSSSSDREKYTTQVDVLQDIVWHITDYTGKLSNDDISYINSLPNSN